MLNRHEAAIFLLLVLFSLHRAAPRFDETGNDTTVTQNRGIVFKRVAIPEGVPISRGTVVQAVSWSDKGGMNIVVVAEYRAGRVLERGYVSELTAAQYVERDSGFGLVSDIKDFDYTDADVSYSEGTLGVFDVDSDTFGDASFFCSIANAEREVIKDMLHTRGTKLAVRGYRNVDIDQDPELVGVELDPAFEQFPDMFREFAVMQWETTLPPGGLD